MPNVIDEIIARKIITESAVSYAASMSGAHYDLFAKPERDEPKAAPKSDQPKKKKGGFMSRIKAKISGGDSGGGGSGGGGGEGSGGGGPGECCVENQYGGGGCGPCDRSK